MNNTDIRRYEMLVRVRDFGASHGDVFPLSTIGGQAFAAVSAAAEALSAHAALQVQGTGTSREGTRSRLRARATLRGEMEAIVRTARALALDIQGLDDRFRIPRITSDQELLSVARAFSREAAPLRAQFITHDMPETFIVDLDRAIAAFETAMRGQREGRETHVVARAAIQQVMATGLAAVRRLDAIVPNRLRNDPEKIALWERAHRVEFGAPAA